MSLYGEIDLPHRPGKHPDWQESWVLIFRDRASGCVGFLRTGAYVNQGTTQTHWGMSLPDGTRFRRHLLDRRLGSGDRTETAASSGTARFSIPNMEYCRFEAHDADAEVDLRIYDFFPSQMWDLIGSSRTFDGDHSGKTGDSHGHPESAGRVEGRVRIGHRSFDIENGIGYREHGFGPRIIGSDSATRFRSGRANFGTVGPKLSFSLLSSQACDGSYHKMGYLIRDGQREQIQDLESVSWVLGDGLSILGGWTQVLLASGEIIRIDVETLDGIVTSTHLNNGGPGSSSAGVEALSIPRWNGLDGICDFNMVDNAHRGEQAVSHLLLANWQDGLSQRERDFSWLK